MIIKATRVAFVDKMMTEGAIVAPSEQVSPAQTVGLMNAPGVPRPALRAKKPLGALAFARPTW